MAASLKSVRRQYTINNVSLTIYDLEYSPTPDIVIGELQDETYKLGYIPFEANDTIIDIGGHVGIISIYLSKKYPFLKIHAFEPVPYNYENFLRNLEANEVDNVTVYNKAVTKNGRELEIVMYPIHTGGATAQIVKLNVEGRMSFTVPSIVLDEFLVDHRIEHCKLLKIDCEGSEYEILYNSKLLNRIEYLSGEFHTNQFLTSQGYTIESLYEYCGKFIDTPKIAHKPEYMYGDDD